MYAAGKGAEQEEVWNYIYKFIFAEAVAESVPEASWLGLTDEEYMEHRQREEEEARFNLGNDPE